MRKAQSSELIHSPVVPLFSYFNRPRFILLSRFISINIEIQQDFYLPKPQLSIFHCLVLLFSSKRKGESETLEPEEEKKTIYTPFNVQEKKKRHIF